MPLIAIDRDKCQRDRICVLECPFQLIIENETSGYPEVRPAAARLCINCGHCLAVCPHGALSLAGRRPEDCPPLRPELLPAADQVAHLLQGRRSIRVYRKQPVERQTLSRLIEVACWAPSAKNQQPVHWLVVEQADQVRRLAGMVVAWLAQGNSYPGIVAAWQEGRDQVLRGAPHLVVAHAAQDSYHPEVDCTIALSYLEIVAASMGVGTCWAGIFMSAARQHPPLIEALELPEGHAVYGGLMLGYPKFKYQRIPPRNPARIRWR